MAQQVTKFLASDNSAFDTEEEADAHDAAMAAEAAIAEYIGHANLQGTKADLVRVHLRQFAKYQTVGTRPQREADPKPRKPRTPKAIAAEAE